MTTQDKKKPAPRGLSRSQNPVLSMSGNMWARLFKYSDENLLVYPHQMSATDQALERRGFIEKQEYSKGLRASPAGRMVADAYREGQEAKA